MSDLSKKYDIEELLRKKVGNLQQAPSDDYWANIDKGIAKARFYKFGWKHFNIYTTSAGVLLLIFIGSLFTFSKVEKGSYKPDSIGTKNTEVIIEPSNDKKEKSSVNDQQNFTTKIQKQTAINKTSTTYITEKPSMDSLVNTTPVKEEKTITIVEPEKKVVPRNKFYVYKTDTIVVDDTVKVKKRRKNK